MSKLLNNKAAAAAAAGAAAMELQSIYRSTGFFPAERARPFPHRSINCQ